MQKSIGRIIYDPKSHLINPRNWVILSCDDSIAEYYRNKYYNEFSIKLSRPVWGAHISIIRGEFISNKKEWNYLNNNLIKYEYDSPLKNNGKHFYLNAYSKVFEEIRSKFDLKSSSFHLTIGVKDD